jgi:hypothetical protein
MPAGINSKLNVIYDDGQVYFTCNELTLHYLKKTKKVHHASATQPRK